MQTTQALLTGVEVNHEQRGPAQLNHVGLLNCRCATDKHGHHVVQELLELPVELFCICRRNEFCQGSARSLHLRETFLPVSDLLSHHRLGRGRCGLLFIVEQRILLDNRPQGPREGLFNDISLEKIGLELPPCLSTTALGPTTRGNDDRDNAAPTRRYRLPRFTVLAQPTRTTSCTVVVLRRAARK